jgi:hypothetical protein
MDRTQAAFDNPDACVHRPAGRRSATIVVIVGACARRVVEVIA